jgi:hypothetical protein
MPEAGPTRRAVLLGTVALAATACSASSGPGTEENDAAIVARVADSKRVLLERYAATAAQHPDKQAVLAPLSAEHELHLTVLGVPERTDAPASRPASPDNPPTASPTPVRIPASAREALDMLSDAERKASDSRLAGILAASPGLARLLASIGACESAHAELLRSAS